MRIPTFVNPRFVEFEGEHQGYLTPEIQSYTDELNQALQNHLSDNGWVPPSLTQTEILATAPTATIPSFWVDDANKALVFKLTAGLFQIPITTPYP